MKCKLCPEKLNPRKNKSGYCTKCYKKSPKWLEYMRIKQREWYAKPKNKKKQKAYRTQPKIKAKHKKYNKKYRLENIDRMRIQKRDWARKNRESLREYKKKWESKNIEKVKKYKRDWKRKQREKKK